MEYSHIQVLCTSAAVVSIVILLIERNQKKTTNKVVKRVLEGVDKDSLMLKKEQLSRNRQFFGEQAQDEVEKAFVIVVGVGMVYFLQMF